MKSLLIIIIKFYKSFISRCFGFNCRFYPSCSTYAIESIEKKGAMIGLFMAILRIFRCNPLSAGGYDPVERGI